MHYIVLDLEWNQSNNGRVVENDRCSLQYEIIEIGAVKTDENFNVISSFDRLVKPQQYLKINRSIAKMLPLTMDDLKSGESIDKVIKEFYDWCGRDYIFCTWGDADLLNLQRNMRFFACGVNYKKPFEYVDLQRIYSEQFGNGIQVFSLTDAVNNLGIEEETPYHRAIFDAAYTAKVGKKLDKNLIKAHHSIDTFHIPKYADEEIHLISDDMEQFVSKGFRIRERALDYNALRSSSCFLCREPMHKEIKWFGDNGKNYYAAFRCVNHGPIIGKFRIKMDEDKEYYYSIRTLSLSDENGIKEIRERKEREKNR